MRNKDLNLWSGSILFFVGALFCYITLQFQLFEVELKMNVPELIINVVAITSALYIAQTIQKNINRNQNKYTSLESKLHIIWHSFSNFSENLTNSDQISISDIASFSKSASVAISVFRNMLTAYQISTVDIDELESKIDQLTDYLETLPIRHNIIHFTLQRNQIDTSVVDINGCFSRLLKILDNL